MFVSKISIIIPTFRRAAILQETLKNIASLDFPKQNYEIIVVDDGSKDKTAEIVQSLMPDVPNLKYYDQKNSGAATARNLGAKMAKYELLLFIDDDILPETGTLEKTIEFHRNYPGSILSGSWIYSQQVLENLQKTPFGRFKIENDYICMGGIDKTKISEHLYETKSLASFCLSMPKTVFAQVGGFNENFPYAGCEDQEFSARAVSLGAKLYYSTDITTFHNELDRGEREKWLKRQFTGVQGFPLLCELFPERKDSPLFRENTAITQNDELKLKVKKIFKKITYGAAGFRVVKPFVSLLEKTIPDNRVLNRLYNLMAGMMIYQGFNMGQKKLTDQNNPDSPELKINSAKA